MLNTCAAPPESLLLDLLEDAKPQPSDLGMMQSVLNAIPSAVIILDSDRQIFFANRAATRLAGKLGHT
ncbi:MAG: PAS domain-containing protein, partial [Gemmatimonadales bacterium]|nr:PAS domain-containing protein [Gemmatimonadales bacterium]